MGTFSVELIPILKSRYSGIKTGNQACVGTPRYKHRLIFVRCVRFHLYLLLLQGVARSGAGACERKSAGSRSVEPYYPVVIAHTCRLLTAECEELTGTCICIDVY